jgi:hypothetical protein
VLAAQIDAGLKLGGQQTVAADAVKRRPIFATPSPFYTSPNFLPYLNVMQQDWGASCERVHIDTVLTADQDVSEARILQLGSIRAPPQRGLLWLEQDRILPVHVQLSPGLVVLAANRAQVRQGASKACLGWEVLVAAGC